MEKIGIRPNYYSKGNLEAWDVIKIFELNFNASIDAINDLSKAITYLNKEIEVLQEKEQNSKKIIINVTKNY